MLLNLAEQTGLNLKKVSSTAGGEYHSSCPRCGGHDRFSIQPYWNGRGRYFCRQCRVRGDAIQFCRDFLGISFKEAQDRIGSSNRAQCRFLQKTTPQVRLPTKTWQDKAADFVESCCKRLLVDLNILALVKGKYGLTPDSIYRFRVGWNFETRFDRRSQWGLEESEKQVRICLPKGIVIPTFSSNGDVSRIKIRRSDWSEGNQTRFAKYQEITGGSNQSLAYGLLTNWVVSVVESELDAMCVCQEVGESCTCLATGGATKRPDSETIAWLQSRRLILYSLDCDDAGCGQYDYWRSTFPNLRAWPAESQKGPADSFVFDGVDLKAWYEEGVRYCEKKY